MTKRVAFHTLGCKLNFAETATIARDFITHGYAQVDFHDPADIYIINTCTVTENADKDCRKIVRQIQRRAPSAFIALTGCYAQLSSEENVQIPGVDAVLGMNEKFKILDLLDTFEKKRHPIVISKPIEPTDDFFPSYSAGERTRAFLKIQDGCDYSCSFCTIPLARGSSRSDTIASTMKAAKKVAATLVREIVLTGVNLGDFGKMYGETFFQLLCELDDIEGIDRIRISSIEPNLLTDEIINLVTNSQKFVPHFHIPLQSGSNKVLSDMRRRYKREDYSDMVLKIKETLPQACIGVDVIVGFPTETEEDFQATYTFLKNLEISYLHVFSYSERPNTLALNFKERVSRDVRSLRSKRLHQLSDEKRHYFQDLFLHQTRKVLFEAISDNNTITGHTDNYIKVYSEGSQTDLNTIRPVKIIENNTLSVKGIM
ncbi:MAG: tRNA (N(6)-L-threonylcarbamoyladenosine(37)-C(2))-methylthiotransferase MtaB [Candidatus Neomarinimicrobiota bacterium]